MKHKDTLSLVTVDVLPRQWLADDEDEDYYYAEDEENEGLVEEADEVEFVFELTHDFDRLTVVKQRICLNLLLELLLEPTMQYCASVCTAPPEAAITQDADSYALRALAFAQQQLNEVREQKHQRLSPLARNRTDLYWYLGSYCSEIRRCAGGLGRFIEQTLGEWDDYTVSVGKKWGTRIYGRSFVQAAVQLWMCVEYPALRDTHLALAGPHKWRPRLEACRALVEVWNQECVKRLAWKTARKSEQVTK